MSYLFTVLMTLIIAAYLFGVWFAMTQSETQPVGLAARIKEAAMWPTRIFKNVQ